MGLINKLIHILKNRTLCNLKTKTRTLSSYKYETMPKLMPKTLK